VAERPSIQQCRARRMFCIWSQRRAVGAEGWHAGAWVDESTTANLVESRPKPRMTDHLQHTLIGVSRQGLFSKECRHVLHGVSHGPNARCGSARGHRGWGRKLSRVLSFVRHANGLSVCLYVGMYVCMYVCLSVWPGQSDADRVNIFCTCATLMGLNGDVPASSSPSRSSEDQFSGLIISATS
jgi:hypothetical protein